MSTVAVVLAAGKSTRMRSRIPKPAHMILGRPMLAHVLFAADAALRKAAGVGDEQAADAAEDDSSRLVVVLGHGAERVQAALRSTPDLPGYRAAVQREPLGTGDAVRAVSYLLAEHPAHGIPSTVLVLYGDSPLVRPETLVDLLIRHEATHATVTILTGQATGDTGYGRIVRGAEGQVRGIIEERHCTPEQRSISEVNSGIYCFRAEWLWSRLHRLQPHDSGEFYLTDLVDLAAAEGESIETVSAPLSETAGVNDRIQLAEATAVLRRRTLDDLMRSGVTIVDPASTLIEPGVRIGMDTIIHPFTFVTGASVIGEDCIIGPYSRIQDSVIGTGCAVVGSWLEGAQMDAGSHIGPMGHLRPGAHLEAGVYLGNFGEVKNATIGRDVKMHHFGFVGDATVGAGTNIGAGVITVNFDGQTKHRTDVGTNAFLGCDTLLVAPVSVGDDAVTGAGSVVTRNVPERGVAVGVPARVIRHKPARREPPAAPDAAKTASRPNVLPRLADTATPPPLRSRPGSASGDGEENASDG